MAIRRKQPERTSAETWQAPSSHSGNFVRQIRWLLSAAPELTSVSNFTTSGAKSVAHLDQQKCSHGIGVCSAPSYKGPPPFHGGAGCKAGGPKPPQAHNSHAKLEHSRNGYHGIRSEYDMGQQIRTRNMDDIGVKQQRDV